MELMHRFGGKADKGYVDFYIKLIKDNPGSGDNIWIGTPYGFPTLEYHRKNADFLIESAKKIRENGISVSIQLSNTIGHSDSHGVSDGLNYEGSKAGHMVGSNGIVCKQCWCYNSREVIDYTVKEVSMYAEVMPEIFWIDDDFRQDSHGPAGRGGCFCPDCIKKFNEENGFNYDRERLTQDLLIDVEVRKKWYRFTRKSLANFLYELSKAIHKVSPKTVIGIQNQNVMYGDTDNYFINAVKKATGMNPTVRPGGGNYVDYNHEVLFDKNSHVGFQNSFISKDIKRKAYEQESLPFTAMNKSVEYNVFETCWCVANDCTDVSYSVLMGRYDVDNYYQELFASLASVRKYLDVIGEINTYTHQAGIRRYLSQNLYNGKDKGNDIYEERIKSTRKFEFHDELTTIQRDGIPVTFDQHDQSLTVITANFAEVLSQDEVNELLTKNVYIDGESIAILGDKLNIGIKAEKLDDGTGLALMEVFAKHPTSPKEIDVWVYSMYSRVGMQNMYNLIDESGKAEVISYYEFKKNLEFDCKFQMTAEEKKKVYSNHYGVASLVVDTGKGGKWYINGYKPWVRSVSQYKRNQMLNVMEYVSGNKICIKPLNEKPIVIYPRENDEGKIVSFNFVNPSIGKNKEKVFVRRTLTDKFRFINMYGEITELKAVKEKDGYIIELPVLDGCSVGSLLCF